MALLAVTILLMASPCWGGRDPTINPASYLQAQVNWPNYTVNQLWTHHKHLDNWLDTRQATADTWAELPAQYDPAYKNPCWQETGGALRCLPYFHILGVSKCGTTDIYHRLSFHSDFVKPTRKGPHFLDEATYPPVTQSAPGMDDGTFRGYIALFDKAAAEIMEDKATRVTGDASSNTYTGVVAHLRGLTKDKQTNSTLAHYLFEFAPWSRFIVLMRNPVKRYYSAFYYYRMHSSITNGPREFHERALRDIGYWNKCIKERGEHHCIKMYLPEQLIKCLYAIYLPYWLEVWPRDRFLFVRNEDYKAAPRPHILGAADFLGLRRLANESWLDLVEDEKARNKKHYPKMLPETQKLLQDFFRPYNQKLARALGNDTRWLWGY